MSVYAEQLGAMVDDREDRVAKLEEALRDLEFVAFAAMNRGHLRSDYELSRAAGIGLAKAHAVLGMTHFRDEPRRIFDINP